MGEALTGWSGPKPDDDVARFHFDLMIGIRIVRPGRYVVFQLAAACTVSRDPASHRPVAWPARAGG
jgi:hypothetical protein